MTPGNLIDVFISTAIALLSNILFSAIMAATTLVCAAWVGYRNHYNFRRALTDTIRTLLWVVGLFFIWYVDPANKLFDADNARIAIATQLMAVSLIIGYWIAAFIIKSKTGIREIMLIQVADWLQKQSESVRANAIASDNIEDSPFSTTAKELRAIHASNISNIPTKKRGRPRKVKNAT